MMQVVRADRRSDARQVFPGLAVFLGSPVVEGEGDELPPQRGDQGQVIRPVARPAVKGSVDQFPDDEGAQQTLPGERPPAWRSPSRSGHAAGDRPRSSCRAAMSRQRLPLLIVPLFGPLEVALPFPCGGQDEFLPLLLRLGTGGAGSTVTCTSLFASSMPTGSARCRMPSPLTVDFTTIRFILVPPRRRALPQRHSSLLGHLSPYPGRSPVTSYSLRPRTRDGKTGMPAAGGLSSYAFPPRLTEARQMSHATLRLFRPRM